MTGKSVFLLFAIVLVNRVTVNAQSKKESEASPRREITEWIVNYHTVILSTPDTNYQLTKYNSPNGDFSFWPGAAEKIAHDSAVTTILNQYKIVYRYVNAIDTLYSCFPLQGNLKEEITEEIRNVLYINSDLADAATYSHILREAELTNLTHSDTTVIRIIDPDVFSDRVKDWPRDRDPMIMNSDNYNIYEVKIINGSALFYSHALRYEYGTGVKICYTDTFTLSRKETKRLLNVYSKINFAPNLKCRNPGIVYFGECSERNKYVQFTVADYCYRYHREYGPYFGLCRVIDGLYRLNSTINHHNLR